jgi:hypothetical protein
MPLGYKGRGDGTGKLKRQQECGRHSNGAEGALHEHFFLNFIAVSSVSCTPELPLFLLIFSWPPCNDIF